MNGRVREETDMVIRVIIAVLTAYLLGGINPAIELSKKVMGKEEESK